MDREKANEKDWAETREDAVGVVLDMDVAADEAKERGEKDK